MTKTIKVHNLDCANCAAKVERALNKIDGVKNASVNFFVQRITLDVDDARTDEVMGEVCRVCKKIEPEMTLAVK